MKSLVRILSHELNLVHTNYPSDSVRKPVRKSVRKSK